MKLRLYMSHLRKLVKDNPEALDMDVIYATDTEGNSYDNIHFKPSIVSYDGIEVDEDEDTGNTVLLN